MRKSRFISQAGAFFVAIVAILSFSETCVFLFEGSIGEYDLAIDTVGFLVWIAFFKIAIFSAFAIRFFLITRFSSTKADFVHGSWVVSAIVSLLYLAGPLALWQCYVAKPSICRTFYDMVPPDRLAVTTASFVVLSGIRFIGTLGYVFFKVGKQAPTSITGREG